MCRRLGSEAEEEEAEAEGLLPQPSWTPHPTIPSGAVPHTTVKAASVGQAIFKDPVANNPSTCAIELGIRPGDSTATQAMSDPPPPPLPPPPTPIMLYIGAGYDLSPLLTFAPGGPSYPIVPLSKQDHAHSQVSHEHGTYTSFLFVDAKPRHTSAYMVPDFHEWTTIEARVKNVLHYAQGALTRWRAVPGAPDLLWFEGGGNAALVDSRSREPAWVFSDLPNTSITVSTQSPDSTRYSSFYTQPLTTLLYLFNTLDVELVHAPLLERVWPRVEALYVHGLRLHVRTGAGMAVSTGINAEDPSAGIRTEANMHGIRLPSKLGAGLKRCYVIVGSWGTPLRNPRRMMKKLSRAQSGGKEENAIVEIGVRHVDFVHDAWSRWKSEVHRRSKFMGARMPSGVAGLPCSSASLPPFLASTPCEVPPILSLNITNTLFPYPAHDTPPSPLVFRSSRVRNSRSLRRGTLSGDAWDSDYDGDSEDASVQWDESEYECSREQGDVFEGESSLESCLLSPESPLPPFFTRIPQLAWSSTLRGGRGGYYVSKTVEESMAVWRARRDGHIDVSEDDMSASDEECNFEGVGKRAESVNTNRRTQYLHGLRSFFHPRAYPSIFSRSGPRSRPLQGSQPCPPGAARDSDETVTENSTGDTVFGIGSCESAGTRDVCEYVSQRGDKIQTACEAGMERNQEHIVFGFWRRFARAQHSADNHVGRLGVGRDAHGLAKTRTRSTHIREHVRHIPSPGFSYSQTWASPPLPRFVSTQRMQITDFSSATLELDAYDAVSGFAYETPSTAHASSSLSSTPSTSTVRSSASPSPVPPASCSQTTLPHSLNGQSSRSDEPVQVQPSIDSSNQRCALRIEARSKTRQHRQKLVEYRWLELAQSISRLFQRGRNTSMVPAKDGRHSPALPPLPTRTPSPFATVAFPTQFLVKPNKDRRLRRHSRDRASTAHGCRFERESPLVPPLPSPFHGHTDMRSSEEPKHSHTHTQHTPSDARPGALRAL